MKSLAGEGRDTKVVLMTLKLYVLFLCLTSPPQKSAGVLRLQSLLTLWETEAAPISFLYIHILESSSF